jgi:DDE superfamily endonuclease
MEQGLIRDMKLHYRYDLLVEMINKNLGISEFHKQLNIKDAIYRINDGWNSLTCGNIQKCFSKIFPLAERNSDNSEANFSVPTLEHFMELIKGIPECEFNGYNTDRLKIWLTCDDAEPKKDCNSMHTLSEEMKDSFKDEEEGKILFENFNEEEMSQTIEIKSSIESQNDDENILPNNAEYEIIDAENIEIFTTNEPSSQDGDTQLSLEQDINEENILYEESTECEIDCQQAINALDVVLRFMKCDSESRYRDVVFLSELKKKLRKRLNDE